jgi:hypothetical protein
MLFMLRLKDLLKLVPVVLLSVDLGIGWLGGSSTKVSLFFLVAYCAVVVAYSMRSVDAEEQLKQALHTLKEMKDRQAVLEHKLERVQENVDNTKAAMSLRR